MSRSLLLLLVLIAGFGLGHYTAPGTAQATPKHDYGAPSDPAEFAVAVTPANSDLAAVTRGVYVGTTGNLTVQMLDSSGALSNVAFNSVPSGSLLPIRAHQIRSTGTTAGNIVAIW